MWTKATSTVPYMLNGEDHYAYIKGYPNGSFKPNATITRAEAASIFYRLLTDTTRKTYYHHLQHLQGCSGKAWYNTAVSTMAKLGIVNGGSDGYFRPSDPITRAEIAAMIARCDGNSYGNAYTNFSDVKGHWAANYIARAYELGWINGYGTTYAPDKYITRAETVAIPKPRFEPRAAEHFGSAQRPEHLQRCQHHVLVLSRCRGGCQQPHPTPERPTTMSIGRSSSLTRVGCKS